MTPLKEVTLGAKELKHISANPILKAQHAREFPIKLEFRGGSHMLDELSKWYHNPKLRDLTIVYGEQGEKTFEGHGFVFCHNSDWFLNASSHWMFKETQDRIIILKEDYPEALEALFEFCYTGNYKEIKPTGDDLLAWTKSLFMRQARISIAADKYMVEGLAELALQRFKERVMCEASNGETAFFKFAVDQLYVHKNLFGYDQQHAEENARLRAESAMEGDSGEDSDEEMDAEPIEKSTPKTSTSSNPALTNEDVSIQDEDFSDNVHHSYDGSPKPSHHPLDHLKVVVIEAAVDVYHLECEGGNNGIGVGHLHYLTSTIPSFGADLALALVKEIM